MDLRSDIHSFFVERFRHHHDRIVNDFNKTSAAPEPELKFEPEKKTESLIRPSIWNHQINKMLTGYFLGQGIDIEIAPGKWIKTWLLEQLDGSHVLLPKWKIFELPQIQHGFFGFQTMQPGREHILYFEYLNKFQDGEFSQHVVRIFCKKS